MSFDIDNQRAIVDRRAIADRLASIRSGKNAAGESLEILRGALDHGRAEIAKRLAQEPGNGRAAAQATAFLHDQLVRLTYDFVCNSLAASPAGGIALVGLGGTGRGEMAPFSDLDLMFLTAKPPTAEQEQIAEAMLHLLWDLKLKVGHSIRSTPPCAASARRWLPAPQQSSSPPS